MSSINNYPEEPNKDDEELMNELKSVFYDRRRYHMIGIRVLPRVRMIWDSLALDEKKVLRDTFERIVVEYAKKSKISTNDKSIVLNINVNPVVQPKENPDETLVKMKKKIDRLEKELNTILSENISLRDENESLKNKIKELETQLQQIQTQAQQQVQVQKLDEKLRKLVSYLQLSKICLSNIDICDINAVIRNIDIIINENKEYTESRERIEQRFKSLYTRKNMNCNQQNPCIQIWKQAKKSL
ncbi:MAG: hypothetical protein QW607_10790 [Desulfurococcaceae archaeon]